ncbi:MAG: hypothetical protein AAFX40_00155 [Cyanobacteria bacterium J06639_1]
MTVRTAIQRIFRAIQTAIADIVGSLARVAFGPSKDDYPATGTRPLREDGKPAKRWRWLR